MSKRLTATAGRRVVDVTPSWIGVGSLPDITLGPPRLGATYETIDAELPFTEGDNTVAGGTLRYRPVGAAWPVRSGPIPLHPVRPASGADQTAYGTTMALYGVIAGRLEPDTAYEVRAQVEDAQGRRRWAYLGTVTTRADAIPAASTLDPTHYVATGGDDSANGTAVGTAWKSLQKAGASTATNGVCRVGPGFYTRPTSAIGATKSFRAEYTAVDDDGAEINVGLQAVIEGPYVTAPTGTPDHTPGDAGPSIGSDSPYVVAPWTAVQVQGTGQTRIGGTYGAPGTADWFGTDDPSGDGNPDGTFWKWTPPDTPITLNAGLSAKVGHAATRTDHPRQIGFVRSDTAVNDSAGGVAEILFTNRDYRYATGAGVCWQDANGDLYLAMPGNARRADGQLSRNPNDFWIKLGDAEPGFEVNADDVRISGFAFHSVGWPIQVDNAKNRTIIDHNIMVDALMGIRMGQQSVPAAGGQDPARYANHTTIERNLFLNYNNWSDDQVNDRSIPWQVIKTPIILENSLSYEAASGYTGANTRWISTSETTAIHGRAGGVRTVVRDNVIDGYMNGICPMGITSGETRYAGYGSVIYRNTWRHVADDVFEYDIRNINVAGWDNDVSYSTVYLSISPTDCGPILHFRDKVWRLGRRGVGRVDNDEPGIGPLLVKHSGGSDTPCLVHLYHLTVWVDDDGSGLIISTNSRASAPFNQQEERLKIRNSIIRVTGYPIDRYARADGEEQSDVDYCLLVTTSPTTHGLRQRTATTDTVYRSTAAWRAGASRGEHVNVVGGSTVDPTAYATVDVLLVDPENGDIEVSAASRSRLVGVPIPGISDAGSCVIGYQP